MRVALWADMLYYRIAGGTTRYVGQVVNELARIPDLDLRLFSLYSEPQIRDAARSRGYPRAHAVASRVPRQVTVLWWQVRPQGRDPEYLRGAEVVHSPLMLVPAHGEVPLIVTVHDMTGWLHREHHTRRSVWLARLALRQALRRRARFIANSAATADDLRRIGSVPANRIFVTPLAADERFRPVTDPAVQARYRIQGPYVLYVGTLEPRKNLDALIHAFAALRRRDVSLVIAGARGWLYHHLYTTVRSLGVAARVVFAGFVPDEDLPALMTSAEVFVYPSVYEGFGLPVLEAMQCGTPVITTDSSSLPEVAGDAALLVSPHDVAGLATAMARVLAEPSLRDDMRARGFDQAARFTWRRTAQLTNDAYRLARSDG
jgi:glycosyltransferase involved in cell wall biosynthesis